MSFANIKTVLILDAITYCLMFLLCVLNRATVAALLGLPDTVVSAAGWICLAAAAPMLVAAAQHARSRALTHLVVAGNLAWVAASLAVLGVRGAQMSRLGIAGTLAQAFAVFMFAWLERKGTKASPRPVAAR